MIENNILSLFKDFLIDLAEGKASQSENQIVISSRERDFLLLVTECYEEALEKEASVKKYDFLEISYYLSNFMENINSQYEQKLLEVLNEYD